MDKSVVLKYILRWWKFRVKKEMMQFCNLVTYAYTVDVNEQTGARPRGALVNDTTINAGRSRSLFIIFQPWEGLEHLSSEPSFLTRPSTSHAPHQATSQKHPPKFPMSLSVQDQDYTAISFHIIVQKSMYHVTWIMWKLRKGKGLRSPGKIQV